MCNQCDIAKTTFKVAKKEAHMNYYPILKLLEAMEKQNRIELYAGDCFLDETERVLESEQHFTVCHYLKCKTCTKFFFIGACIRGTPKYKILRNLKNEDPTNLIWGKRGILYEN